MIPGLIRPIFDAVNVDEAERPGCSLAYLSGAGIIPDEKNLRAPQLFFKNSYKTEILIHSTLIQPV
jgi:hypothetical protein